MCFATSTRFVKTPQLSPTVLVHCCTGWRALRGKVRGSRTKFFARKWPEIF